MGTVLEVSYAYTCPHPKKYEQHQKKQWKKENIYMGLYDHKFSCSSGWQTHGVQAASVGMSTAGWSMGAFCGSIVLCIGYVEFVLEGDTYAECLSQVLRVEHSTSLLEGIQCSSSAPQPF